MLNLDTKTIAIIGAGLGALALLLVVAIFIWVRKSVKRVSETEVALQGLEMFLQGSEPRYPSTARVDVAVEQPPSFAPIRVPEPPKQSASPAFPLPPPPPPVISHPAPVPIPPPPAAPPAAPRARFISPEQRQPLKKPDLVIDVEAITAKKGIPVSSKVEEVEDEDEAALDAELKSELEDLGKPAV
jgi:hypothetical protein